MATPDELQPSRTGGTTDASQGRAGDDHAGPTVGADPEAVRAGHEPDEVSVRGILIVPGIIVVGFVVAYITVTILIKAFRTPDVAAERSANPMALKHSQAPVNERLERITAARRDGGDEQPRLEGLKEYEYGPNDPPYARTRLPSPKGNSPEYHPEDLRPDRIPYLSDTSKAYGWVENGKVAHIPIERAIEIAARNRNVLPIQPNPVKPELFTGPGRPKQTNSGRGIPGRPEGRLDLDRPRAEKEANGKDQPKAEGKKEEPKKEAPKTEGKEKGPAPKEKGGTEGKK